MQLYDPKEIDINEQVSVYDEHLNGRGYVYMDLECIEDAINTADETAKQAERLLCEYLVFHNHPCREYNKSCIIEYFVHDRYVPVSTFSTKNTKGLSLDRRKVVPKIREKLKVNHYVLDLNDLYSENKTLVSNLTKLVNRRKKGDPEKAADGSNIWRIPFEATLTNNFRFNYKSEAIINIPRTLKNSFKVPEGKVIVYGDFANADMRSGYNTHLISEDNIDLIMEFEDDTYAGMAALVNKYIRENVNPDEPVFTGFKSKAERDKYKVYFLAVMYGTRSTPISEDLNFVNSLVKVLESSPKYSQYIEDIQTRLKFGIPIYTQTIFGQVATVDQVSGVNKWLSQQSLHRALNYPVQGTTSDLVIITVNRIIDTMRGLGIGKDMFDVYFVRHDEPLFVMDEHLIDEISWVFKDYETIVVPGWLPYRMDFMFARNYGEVDKDLMDRYESCSTHNKHQLGEVTTDLTISNGYVSPLKPILFLSMHECNGTVVIINDKTEKLMIRTTGEEGQIASTLKAIEDKASGIKHKYDFVVVANVDVNNVYMVDSTLTVVFSKDLNVHVKEASVLARLLSTPEDLETEPDYNLKIYNKYLGGRE